jgi:hypothetical protein
MQKLWNLLRNFRKKRVSYLVGKRFQFVQIFEGVGPRKRALLPGFSTAGHQDWERLEAVNGTLDKNVAF